MGLEKTLENSLQEYSDYKKQYEFFVVDRPPTMTPVKTEKEKQKEWEERKSSWLKLCEDAHLPLESFWQKRNGDKITAFGMDFSNGLTIADDGFQVFFNATKNKENVDIASALTVIRCAANHLYRETGGKPYISTNRPGSNEMKDAFNDACDQARLFVNRAWIEKCISEK